MRNADLTKDQRDALAAWVEGGFREYADLCGKEAEKLTALFKDNARMATKVNKRTSVMHDGVPYQGRIHRNIRTQIKMYAKEFGPVLCSEGGMSDKNDPLDLAKLRSDLYGLMKLRCPPVALGELMLACTSNYGVTIPDLLLRAWLLDGYLEGISGGPSFEIRRRPRRFKVAVPLSIQFMLDTKPYYANADGKGQAVREAFHVAYFHTFLKHFRYGHETLSEMLRTMQYVRRRVPAVADYLQVREKDTFSAHALQRRVCRFFESNQASKKAMRQEVRNYLSGAGVESRKTLLSIY